MPEREKSLWAHLLVGLILLSPVLGMVLYRHLSVRPFAPPPRWAQVQPGLNQAEVRALVGSPTSVDYLHGGDGTERYLIRPYRWHYPWGLVEFDEHLLVCAVGDK